jgi:nicotinamidase-related amidase
MTIDAKTTAVVLIEFQNDFTSEGGVLHGAVSEVMDKTGMLANTHQLAEAARTGGATVMHAPITFAEGYNEISAHPYGILKGRRRERLRQEFVGCRDRGRPGSG